jgi:hypothetical protein
MTPSMTATHANVTGLTARLENMVHKLHVDVFLSPALTIYILRQLLWKC